MGMSFAAMLVLLLGGGATDLLDLVHTDSYWKSKQVIVSVEQLITDATSANADQPTAIRRLMAIRTLGEMKQADAVEKLKPLLDSKDPFIADYTQTALAKIAGKPTLRPALSPENRMADVWLLPTHSDLVAQAAGLAAPVHSDDLFANMPLPPGANKAEMFDQITNQLLPILEMIGNVRLQALTVGVCANAPNQPGYVVLIARGQFNAKAIAAAMTQHNLQPNLVDGTEVFQPEPSTSLIFPSDTRAVIVITPNDGPPPLEAIVVSLKKNAGGLHDNPDMLQLLTKIDTTHPIWAVAKMTDSMRQSLPPLAPFDTGSLAVSQKDDVMTFALKAEGSDPEKVKTATDNFDTQLQTAITQLRNTTQTLPGTKPVLDALETIQIKTDNTKATATGSMKGSMSLSMMLFGIRSAPHAAPAPQGKPAGV
jgi:hypothetical protein